MATNDNVNRRDFLRGVTLASMGMGLLVEEITEAQQKPAEQPAGPPVNVGVIGLGPRGREILASLAKLGPGAPVVALCDTFQAPVFLKKATVLAPKAAVHSDYKVLLSQKDVQAVFVATPTHKHRQIVLDALQAGKHVYCEAPLAHTVEEAKAIAQAAKAAKTVFQAGLQQRCNGQTVHVSYFVRSGAAGKLAGARAQWHKRTSWRQTWPSSDREAELNWRLRRETSPGLLGEIAIHQFDIASWYFKNLPTAVTGFGGIMEYADGRTVHDTVQCVLEFPRNLRLLYDATLVNSFDDAYELFLGSDAALMLRDLRGWMFKEPGAGQLGWEVFARKDLLQVGKPENGTGLALGTGIALVADATKQLALGQEPGKVGTDVSRTALFQAVEVFIKSARAGKRVPVREPTTERPNPPLAPGAEEGYQATVVALKANEAALAGSRIEFQKDLFVL